MSFVKQHMFKVILGIALVSAFAVPASAQELKIGVVNIPVLMERSPQTKAAMDALQEEFAPRQREFLAKQKEYEELEKAYSFMLQLRFVRQITAIVDEKSKPDNYINPKDLTRIEQKMLKEIFLRVGNFQSKLDVEFIGMV